MATLFRDASRAQVGQLTRADIADYHPTNGPHPLTRLGDVGVVATRDIKAGELLSVAKSLVFVHRELPQRWWGWQVKLGPARYTMSHWNLLSLAIQEAQRSQYAWHWLHNMRSGEANAATLTMDAHGTVNVTRLARVALLNAREVEGHVNKETGMAPYAMGIWPTMTSWARHSCLPNTEILYVSDVQIVVARADIPKGAEVTVRWVNVERSQEEKDSLLRQAFGGLVCDCSLCQELRGSRAGDAFRWVEHRVSAADDDAAFNNTVAEIHEFGAEAKLRTWPALAGSYAAELRLANRTARPLGPQARRDAIALVLADPHGSDTYRAMMALSRWREGDSSGLEYVENVERVTESAGLPVEVFPVLYRHVGGSERPMQLLWSRMVGGRPRSSGGARSSWITRDLEITEAMLW